MEKDANWLRKEKYNGQENPEYLKDIERLKAGEPLAYIIGHMPFLNCTIYLDSKPLIPRPETEFWVAQAIKRVVNLPALPHPVLAHDVIAAEDSVRPIGSPITLLKQIIHEENLEAGSPSRKRKGFPHEGVKILDLCAGSGCIGVALAKAIPEAHITFGEINPLHVPTIIKNCIANGIAEERFTILTSDLFENISGQFDLILCNPPYIDPALDRTEPSVKAHEPHQALYGGRGGIEHIEKIIAAAPAHLTKDSQLWVEHEPEQAEFISSCGDTYGFKTTTHSDQYEIARYSVLEKTL